MTANQPPAPKSHFSPVNVFGETHYENPEGIKDATFCDFDYLYAENTRFENCIFEDCRQMTADSCTLVNCTFHNVSGITGDHSDFLQCTFEQCCSYGPLLVIDGQGLVEGCTFDTITALGDDGHIIEAVYKRKADVELIHECRFWDCQAEAEDGQLCACCYFRPFFTYTTVSIDNVDYDSCEGLR